MMETHFQLQGEDAMVHFGVELAASISGHMKNGGVVVFLEGDLGMGKTTLSRGVLNGLGHNGAVKSPTYTLVEPYELDGIIVYHFDLYRLGDPEELEYMGIRDYFDSDNLCLVEWAEKGAGFLPPPDLVFRLSMIDDGRDVEVVGNTSRGAQILDSLKARLKL
jgi:tRNA threonylcarbamoyladenosine biosynthesis protein TsaE